MSEILKTLKFLDVTWLHVAVAVDKQLETQAARIAELEAALRGIIDYVEDTGRDYCEWYHDTKEMARAALEGKK